MTGNGQLKTKYKTVRRFDDPGHAHCLTFSCFKRRHFLSKERSREWLIEALDAARRRRNFELWAYVIMPEHAHVVVLPNEADYSVSRILASIKLPVTRRALAYVRREAPDFLAMMRDEQPSGQVAYRFWQRGGGYDRNLVAAKAIQATIDYIHANPVRRGLVNAPQDWRWSSAAYFAGKADVPLVPDVDSIPGFGHP